jgi:hypothetical protein
VLTVCQNVFDGQDVSLSMNVPSDWKKALITPLFKKGERNVASNYRPVSLTSVVSKILIVHSSRVQVFKEFDDTIFSYVYVVHTLCSAVIFVRQGGCVLFCINRLKLVVGTTN